MEKIVENNITDLSVYEVINNYNNHQFEISINNSVAKLPYKLKGNLLILLHTDVPEEWRGRGIATKLAEYALNFAKKNNLIITPYCHFLKEYIKSHS